MSIATDIVDRTCGVESLRERIDILDEARIDACVLAAPRLVERCPRDYRRVVAVALYELCPLAEEVACRQVAVLVETPACRLAPREVAQMVGPIVIALLKALLVQTSAVETDVFCQFNVAAQGLVGGCCPDAVGVETLIEYKALIVGTVVQIEESVGNMRLPHAGIGANLVDDLLL